MSNREPVEANTFSCQPKWQLSNFRLSIGSGRDSISLRLERVSVIVHGTDVDASEIDLLDRTGRVADKSFPRV
jgi:hypothetical protein